MLSDLAGVVAGLTTAGDIEAAVTAWFDAAPGGGGFLDSAYGGATGTATRFALAPGDSTSIDITAADPGIRSLLKGFALGALLTQGVLGGDTAARAALAGAAGAELVAAGNRVLDLQTGLGTVEARLSDAAARNANEAAALKVARSSIIAADPYETATALQEAQTRMETLYTLTAHLSQLSLADYLR